MGRISVFEPPGTETLSDERPSRYPGYRSLEDDGERGRDTCVVQNRGWTTVWDSHPVDTISQETTLYGKQNTIGGQ